ncbi:D-alanyl-D-alanine carboxypeptidase family protein [Blautia sp.]|uniref:serine-type D-Ala-D-Ala carboxypeptidase n=1 Tax=Blautia glucerasea TaxID=536633 RepID=A0A6N2S9U6_9FIRM
MRRAVSKILLASVFFLCCVISGGQWTYGEEQKKDSSENVIPGNIYSLSAVLMDGDTGRILYDKEGSRPRPNASTTKVMTCILALEYGAGDDYVQVSANAASQPDVQLGMKEGEQYYLEDLLYSLMLKSHNDTAVAIAEHIGGSTEKFAEMMNEKAKKIGCKDTYFITPNGLDAEDENGIHHTTAQDLALIMRYAIQSRTFLKITETIEYSFSDLSGKRQFSLHNTNALLTMTDGVLSGKTGFTGDAGYCYVCACKREEKLFIIALLGCGWPNNKGYKWKDTLKLLNFGDENFSYQTCWKEPSLPVIKIEKGVQIDSAIGDEAVIQGILSVEDKEKNKKILLKKGEQMSYELKLKENIKAPVAKGEKIGTYSCILNGETIASYPVLSDRKIDALTYQWCVEQVFHGFFH